MQRMIYSYKDQGKETQQRKSSTTKEAHMVCAIVYIKAGSPKAESLNIQRPCSWYPHAEH